MTFPRDRRSPGIPRWTLAVLAACVLANTAIDLVLATVEYLSWEEFYPTRGLNVVNVLGSLGNHLWFTVRQGWIWALIVGVGYLLARRGRRWLFAFPALALVLAPLLVGLIRGLPVPLTPEFGTYAWSAQELDIWVSWLISAVRTSLFLIPGFVVVRYAERERNPFQIPALLLVAVPALVAGYLGVLIVSPTGRIQDSGVELFIAAFFFGAAMGFDRPFWPWLLVAAPGLLEGLPSLLYFGGGNEMVVTLLIAILGASSVPFSRILYRGWQENAAPGSPQGADSPVA